MEQCKSFLKSFNSLNFQRVCTTFYLMEIEDHDPTSNASPREEESLIRVVVKTLSGHNFNVEIDRNVCQMICPPS